MNGPKRGPEAQRPCVAVDLEVGSSLLLLAMAGRMYVAMCC